MPIEQKTASGAETLMTNQAPNANPRWTPEEDEILRNLVLEGRSAAAIAERTQRSINSVYSRAQKLRITLSRLGVRRRSVSKWG